jgi:beta-glucosidase/6-phospho-beta-glucosidase/beta-galactosidase
MQWEHKRDSLKFEHFCSAIQKGLDKIWKYYSKFDEKPVYILALGMLQYHLIHGLTTDCTISSSTSLL